MATTLTSLKQLELLASKINDNFARATALATLNSAVEELKNIGGEPNKIEKVKVNQTLLTKQ